MKLYLTCAVFVFVVLHCCIYAGACINGYVRYGSSCYHVSHGTDTWADGMTICRLEKGNLATIESATENSFLVQLLQSHSVSNAWIAATDLDVEGDWRWWPSKEILAYKNWASTEPNDSGAAEDCAELLPNGLWYDADCKLAKRYICEMPYEGTEVIG